MKKGWNINTTRPITNKEQEVLDGINELLGDYPNEKIFAFLNIKCATEEGFFESMLKHAFLGFSSQNNILRSEVSILSNALFMAERCITKRKKETKTFKEHFKYAILKGLRIAQKCLNINDLLSEYEGE